MSEQTHHARPSRTLLFTLTAVALLFGASCGDQASAADPPRFGAAFWWHWGDGQAELAGYDLTYPRYGELRRGTAVAIFVTETFSNQLRVKADPGQHPASDEYPVMKLNLIHDFPTGIYDYNMMTSAFVALKPVNGRPAGWPTKVSFSSQEWCGHVYQQLLFDKNAVRHQVHSYFDGEADQDACLDDPGAGVSEDMLLLWARNLAGPIVGPGQAVEVSMLRSVIQSRLQHVPLEWFSASLSRSAETEQVNVPAGQFDVRTATAEIGGGRTWTFHVEAAFPHRVVHWSNSDGEAAQMLKSTRLQYWKLNGPGGEAALAELGLTARAPRTP